MNDWKTNTSLYLSQLLPTARGIVECLLRRGANVTLHPVIASLYKFELSDGKSGYFYGSMPLETSMIGGIVAKNKHYSTPIAKEYGLDVPAEIITDSYEDAKDFLRRYDSIVVKPIDGARGRDVITGITSENELKDAWKRIEGERIVQEHCRGQDISILMLDGEILYSLYRHPATVMGDGISTVAELVEHENRTNPKRNGQASLSSTYPISLTHAREYLGSDIYQNHIPKKDELFRVCGPANTSLGGKIERIGEHNVIDGLRKPLQSLSKALGLSLVGFDFILDNEAQRSFFIEYNVIPTVWVEETDAIEKLVDYAIKKARKL